MKKIIVNDLKEKTFCDICCEDELVDEASKWLALNFACGLVESENKDELSEYEDGISYSEFMKLVRERSRSLEIKVIDWNDYKGKTNNEIKEYIEEEI